MKPEDLKLGDIVRAPDGQLWNVDWIMPNGSILVVQRLAVNDLTGWEKADAYQLTGGKEQPSK